MLMSIGCTRAETAVHPLQIKPMLAQTMLMIPMTFGQVLGSPPSSEAPYAGGMLLNWLMVVPLWIARSVR
jgi:hypothetical protein